MVFFLKKIVSKFWKYRIRLYFCGVINSHEALFK